MNRAAAVAPTRARVAASRIGVVAAAAPRNAMSVHGPLKRRGSRARGGGRGSREAGFSKTLFCFALSLLGCKRVDRAFWASSFGMVSFFFRRSLTRCGSGLSHQRQLHFDRDRERGRKRRNRPNGNPVVRAGEQRRRPRLSSSAWWSSREGKAVRRCPSRCIFVVLS